MESKNCTRTFSVCLDSKTAEEIEELRKMAEDATGTASRSVTIRWVLRQGLAKISQERGSLLACLQPAE